MGFAAEAAIEPVEVNLAVATQISQRDCVHADRCAAADKIGRTAGLVLEQIGNTWRVGVPERNVAIGKPVEQVRMTLRGDKVFARHIANEFTIFGSGIEQYLRVNV